jgi:hypothetical protein
VTFDEVNKKIDPTSLNQDMPHVATVPKVSPFHQDLLPTTDAETTDEYELSEAPVTESEHVSTSPPPRRISRIPISVNRLSYDNQFQQTTNLALLTELAAKALDLEPQDVIQGSQWLHAMNEEMTSLYENKTWTLVKLPPGRKTVGLQWIQD